MGRAHAIPDVSDDTWPLVGRDGARHAIRAAVHGPGLVIAGQAGTGRTRLARECVDIAADHAIPAMWSTATRSGQSTPLAALTSAARDGQPSLSQFHSDLADRAARAQSGVPLLVVDDAHLLDDASACLLLNMVVREEMALILTVRSGEPAPDAVTALWRDEHLPRLDLDPLTEDDVECLLQSALGGVVGRVSIREIWRHTRGNLPLLRQLVVGALQTGTLREHDGVWVWAGSADLPSGLLDLVLGELNRFGESVREVLDMVALAEPLELSVLADLTTPTAVEQAQELGLVSVAANAGTTHVRLAQPAHSVALRELMPELRAQRLRGRIALALAAADPKDRVSLVQRATLIPDSDLLPDPDLFTRAAQHTLARGDLGLTERLARRAAALSPDFTCRLLLAYSLTWQDRGDEAEELLARLTAETSDDTQLVQAAFVRANNLFWTMGDTGRAHDVLAATHLRLADRDAQLSLTAADGCFHALQGVVEPAGAATELALTSTQLSPQALLMATAGFVVSRALSGRIDEITEVAETAYATERAPQVLRNGLVVMHARALGLAGRIHEAGSLISAQGQIVRLTATPRVLAGAVGHHTLTQGKVDLAVQHLREALARVEDPAVPGSDYGCLIDLATGLAMRGEHQAAQEVLAGLAGARHPGQGYLDTEFELAQAWVHAAAGTLSTACAIAANAAATAAANRMLGYEVLALHTIVRFGDPGPRDRLVELAGIVDGPRAQVAAQHARALSDAAGDDLLLVASRWEELGDTLAAAEAAAQAVRAYAEAGRRGGAHSAQAHLHRLLTQCGSARTPAIQAALAPLPLTAREREIVSLAAQGLPNAAIAAQLVVSVRTVEGHLYRTYAKLGITSRDELTSLPGLSSQLIGVSGHDPNRAFATQPDGRRLHSRNDRRR